MLRRWGRSTVPSPEFARLLDLLESRYLTAHEDVQNLSAASFVEMVQVEPDLVRLFGPALLSKVESRYRAHVGAACHRLIAVKRSPKARSAGDKQGTRTTVAR